MKSLTVGARAIELDKDGFLVELSDWSTAVSYTHLTLPTNREV